MPIGTCTIAESTLSADTKHALGRRDRDGGHSGSLPSRRNECFSSFKAAQRISPWKAVVCCPSLVMNKAGSPGVDEDRQCVPASNC